MRSSPVAEARVVDENGSATTTFINAESYNANIADAFTPFPRKSAPGTVWVYQSVANFILTQGMNAYLKTLQGSSADLFNSTHRRAMSASALRTFFQLALEGLPASRRWYYTSISTTFRPAWCARMIFSGVMKLVAVEKVVCPVRTSRLYIWMKL